MFSPTNFVRNAKTVLRNPRYLYNRVGVMVDQMVHPEDPWLTRNAVDQLASYLKPTMKGFEWGSGRSTVWLARRLEHLVSIEHNAEWHSQTKEKLTATGLLNVDYRLVPQTAYARQIEEFPNGYFDFIVIDGEDRNNCIVAAAAKVHIGGWVVVDNADSGYDFGPLAAFDLQQTSNGVWRTDLFTRHS